MAKVKIAGVKGMNDMLPADAPIWEKFEDAARQTAASYGYRQIRTPILEATQLFSRGIGEVTDIVEKEMYSFTDSMNGEQLTLRPETLRLSFAPSSSTISLMELRRGCGTSARCFGMNGLSVDAIVSFINSAAKRSALRAPILTSKCLPCSRVCGSVWALRPVLS